MALLLLIISLYIINKYNDTYLYNLENIKYENLFVSGAS
jgi:hypothetical protein